MSTSMLPIDDNEDFHRLRRELEDACSTGDIARVRRLFAVASLEPTDATETLTTSEGYPLATVRCLLELGADPEPFVPWGAWQGQIQSVEAMELLVEFGYDIKANGHLILQDFVSSPEMLDWMLDRGADITRTDDSRTGRFGPRRMLGGGKDYSLKVLNRVAAQGNVELFDHLVVRGAEPSRSLALHCASECKDPAKTVAMIDHLLDKYHFDIEADNRQFLKTGPRSDLGTPLHCAVYHRNIDAVRHLLERGADPESGVRIAIGSKVVIREGWLPALEALLDAGANIDWAFDRTVDAAVVEAAKACLSRGTVSPNVIERQRTRSRPISSGSHAIHVKERAKMDALLQSLGGDGH